MEKPGTSSSPGPLTKVKKMTANKIVVKRDRKTKRTISKPVEKPKIDDPTIDDNKTLPDFEFIRSRVEHYSKMFPTSFRTDIVGIQPEADESRPLQILLQKTFFVNVMRKIQLRYHVELEDVIQEIMSCQNTKNDTPHPQIVPQHQMISVGPFVIPSRSSIEHAMMASEWEHKYPGIWKHGKAGELTLDDTQIAAINEEICLRSDCLRRFVKDLGATFPIVEAEFEAEAERHCQGVLFRNMHGHLEWVKIEA